MNRKEHDRRSIGRRAEAAVVHHPPGRLISRFMGETAAKLRLVFDAVAQTRAVYLFDEFDALGAERAAGNDVGEARRILNSFGYCGAATTRPA